jgi:ribosomal protein S1
MADNTDAWRDFCRFDGVVIKIVPFGAFIEVVPGVVGLLPDKERAATLTVGERIPVRVLQIGATQQRLSLTAA